MNFISSNKYKKLFLTKSSNFDIKEKVDLVLAPEFYWLREFEIPVSNSKEALKVVATLFEDILPSGDFEYHVISSNENKFLCFAYENSEILDAIKNSNLANSQINAVYFAQTEMKKYDSFFIQENAFIYNDNILVKIPKAFVNDGVVLSETLDIKSTSNKIDIKFYNSTLNQKSLTLLSFLLLLIITVNLFKYFSYSNDIDTLEKTKDSIKQQNSLPSSMIQTKSILKSVNSKVSKQIKLREALFYVMNFKKVSNQGKLSNIEYVGKALKLEFVGVNNQRVKNYIAKKYKITRNRTKGNISIFEVKIWID